MSIPEISVTAGQVSVSAGPGGSRVVPVFTMPAAVASSAAGP